MLAESYLTLLGDLNHWAFELTVEAITFGLGVLWGSRWVKRHLHGDLLAFRRDVEEHMHDDIKLGPEEWHQG